MDDRNQSKSCGQHASGTRKKDREGRKVMMIWGFCIRYCPDPCCGRDTLPVWNYVQTRACRACDGYEFCDGGESIPDAQGVCAASKEKNRKEVKNDGDRSGM
jgi:Pyruvate/2-oxoacid:ferredoxin oxidoreductase delta subunit